MAAAGFSVLDNNTYAHWLFPGPFWNKQCYWMSYAHNAYTVFTLENLMSRALKRQNRSHVGENVIQKIFIK